MPMTQENRRIRVTTPLGPDILLLKKVRGSEAISSLFRFDLDMISEQRTSLQFDRILGQPISVEIETTGGGKRYINGIANRFARGSRGMDYTSYSMEIVPKIWLLTRIRQSRIFQQISVPDIIKQVLEGFEVAYEIQGTFEQRDYCVQYRESDFEFISRLMEEEGIYYYFKHTADNHKMVIANTPQSHEAMPVDDKLIYEEVFGGTRDEERITAWNKTQELRSGKVTLWDHCFELPHKHLEAEKTVLENVKIGTINQKLKVGGNDKLEIYDYPGAYAQRFDGIDKGGGENPSDVRKIFEDNKRTVSIRMEQETVAGIEIQAESDYLGVTAGHKFSLTRHFTDDGMYVAASVHLHCEQEYVPNSESPELKGSNEFTCIPFELPYRPLQVTPKPLIHGTQTAVVVGPAGEEIFTDKYSRVKVQFHWDRTGQNDASSSCWIRVATFWAGGQWGGIHIPRIGQEVVVAFEEGDPDRPIVAGSVYNAQLMPPYELPANKTQSGIRSRTVQGGKKDNNEIRFEDKQGVEHIYIHAQKDFEMRVENDRTELNERDFSNSVNRDFVEKVGRDVHQDISRDLVIKTGRDIHVDVGGKQAVKIGGSLSVKAQAVGEEFASHSESTTGAYYLKAANITIEASANLSLKVGGSFVTINAGGVQITGPMVMINSGGAAGAGVANPLVSPSSPSKPKEPMKPGETVAAALAAASASSSSSGGGGGAGGGGGGGGGSDAPSHDPKSEENKEKTHWIEVQMLDDAGQPIPSESVEVTTPDGSVSGGTTDEKGVYRVEHIDPGNCQITFPNLDKDAWEPK
jgi:type VI secretion system secreted protein VgrG